MRAAPRPANISTNEEADCEKNCAPDSWATALASSVLPVPGGPCSSTPLGTARAERCGSAWGRAGTRRPRCSSSLASSTPAISSQPTSRFAWGLICDRLGLRHHLQRAPEHVDDGAHEDETEDAAPVGGELLDVARDQVLLRLRDERDVVQRLRRLLERLDQLGLGLEGLFLEVWRHGEVRGHGRSIGQPGIQCERFDSTRRISCERGAPDLELRPPSGSRVPSTRCSSWPGRRSARAAARAGVALGPREDLDGDAERRQRRPRRCAAGAGPLDRAAQQRGAGEVRRQQRRHQVRAAAVVLLGRVARVGGVRARRRRSPCARRRGRRRARRRAARRGSAASESAATAASPPAPRVAARAAARPPARGGGHRAEDLGVLERQLRLGQRALDERDDDDRLAEAHDAARRPATVVDALQRAACGPEATRDRAVAGGAPRRPSASGRGRAGRCAAPSRRAAACSVALASVTRAAPRQTSRKKRAAKPRSRTSMRSSAAWISGAVSYSVMWRCGKKP